jgi:hypothetical protein
MKNQSKGPFKTQGLLLRRSICKPLFMSTMLILASILSCTNKEKGEGSQGKEPAGSWSPDRVNEWYEGQPWLFGTNFIPSTAINQIEMWQESSWDPETIERELGYAKQIGMNSIRVFLHYLVWKEEGREYIKRIERFLELADNQNIRTIFVFLDDCWDPSPCYGRQKSPLPFVHNSGWVQCPGWEILSDTARHRELEPYVRDIMVHFRADERILAWDLYNEPGNLNSISYADKADKPDYSLLLLKNVFRWAREVNPSQPLTTGVWVGDWSDPDSLSALNRFSLDHSDFISFHCYHDIAGFKNFFEPLERYNRPVICTEFMSRKSGGSFGSILPYMEEHAIGGFNWGLVSGKTQTIYSWESWTRDVSGEADFWHHDILRKDGTPYLEEEVALFLELTANNF